MIFDKGFTEKLKLDMAERLSPKRYKHTLGVAAAAVKLAHIYGLDEEKAEVAGLLHDAEKEAGLEEMQSLADSLYADSLDPEIMEQANLLHGYAVLKYNILDKEIVDAIAHHTTGAKEMKPLEKVIFMADYIEENRDFPGVGTLREIAFKDLDRAVLAGYDMTISYLLQEEKTIFTGTVVNRKALLNEMRRCLGK